MDGWMDGWMEMHGVDKLENNVQNFEPKLRSR